MDWIVKNNIIIVEFDDKTQVGGMEILGSTGLSKAFKVAAFDETLKDEGRNKELVKGCYVRLMNGTSLGKFRFNNKYYAHVYFHEVMATEPA